MRLIRPAAVSDGSVTSTNLQRLRITTLDVADGLSYGSRTIPAHSSSFAIRGILDHLRLSTPQAEKPPPLRVAEHGLGWGRAGTVGVTRIRR